MKGIIEYNDEGLPKCEICGNYFKRVLSHVRQKHNLNEREYKLKYGFDLKKGICSFQSSLLSREKVLQNYDLCINKNLLSKGETTHFKKGHKGRTKDQVSLQTKLMLKERLKEPEMIKAMQESGRKVGKSGLGNLAKLKNKNI